MMQDPSSLRILLSSDNSLQFVHFESASTIQRYLKATFRGFGRMSENFQQFSQSFTGNVLLSFSVHYLSIPSNRPPLQLRDGFAPVTQTGFLNQGRYLGFLLLVQHCFCSEKELCRNMYDGK